MAKCCDKCKAPINPKEMCKITFEIKFRERVKSIMVAIQRRMNGMNDYDDKITIADFEMCEDCRLSLTNFLNGADVVKHEKSR
ncbi:hypothetical protein ACFQZ1_15225 [Bacillus sp. CGMCC 1.60114]|uniref:hypothetical protein n=1 Tax=unclassified Bacillus (in: firmicutes) TaxID=185979 RepID=UPI00362D10AF